MNIEIRWPDARCDTTLSISYITPYIQTNKNKKKKDK